MIQATSSYRIVKFPRRRKVAGQRKWIIFGRERWFNATSVNQERYLNLTESDLTDIAEKKARKLLPKIEVLKQFTILPDGTKTEL